MAIPEKRKVGTMVKWLGFLPCPMHGLIVVQQSKLVRATLFIQQALSGALSVTRYRSLLGFLEHLKVLLTNAKTRMYGLYRPLKQGQEITQGPATLVRIDDRMRTSLKAWILALATTAAAPVTYALPRERFKAPIGAWRFFSSDASKEGTLTPGIAGYMHGVFWVHVYPSDWLWLPIAVLEFLALAVSIIVFEPLLDSTPHVVIETDSLTTALVLSADSASRRFWSRLTPSCSPLRSTPPCLLVSIRGVKWRLGTSMVQPILPPTICPAVIRLRSLCSAPT
jgi:hypothetical protein